MPFQQSIRDPATCQFASDVFTRVFAQLTTSRPDQLDLQPTVDPSLGDQALRAMTKAAGASHVLVARPDSQGSETLLIVSLISVSESVPVWMGRYPVREGQAAETARQISAAVLAAVPAKPATP